MSLLAWVFLAIINGFILDAIEPDPEKSSLVSAVALGLFGALSGGILAFSLFGGTKTGNTITFVLVVLIESSLLLLLILKQSQRSSKKVVQKSL